MFVYEQEVIEIAPKWYEIAEKTLEEGDKIQKSFQGRLDGDGGYLCLSNKKLLFVHEEGFLSKSYELILDLPKEKIEKISQDGKYKLDIVETEGKKHKFNSLDIPASVIEKAL